MNEEVTTETPAEPQREELPTGSLAEHEATYTGEKPPPIVPELEPPAETPAAPLLTTQQKRDKESGKFTEGKVRHRAKSQQAGADDVPRIKELTRQIRERDEELARLRQPASNGNGTAHAPQQPPAPAAPAQTTAPKATDRFLLPAPPFDPEPKRNDPRYGGDVTNYTIAAAQWSARQEVRQQEFDRYVASENAKQAQTEQDENKAFSTRVDAAKAEYEDYEDVAFGPTPIVKDTIPDIFIRRDDNGAKVLYYLHHPTHRQELDELLKMPELAQVKFLSLLSQRLSSNGDGAVGSTTSTPASRTIVLPPRPPNVVRTEAQPARSGLPTDRPLSLSEHEHYYRPKPRR